MEQRVSLIEIEKLRNELKSFISYNFSNINIFADDIVNESIFLCYKNADKFNAEQSALKTWLFSIAKRLAIDYIRKYKSNTVSFSGIPESESDFEIPDKSIGENNNLNFDYNRLKKSVIQAINSGFKKPEIYLKVYELYFLKGLEYSEISESLNLSIANVKVIINRLRNVIQKNKNINQIKTEMEITISEKKKKE